MVPRVVFARESGVYVKKIAWFYNHLEEYLLVVLLLIAVTVGFLQVIMRYVFNNSLTWTEEFSRVLFIWMSWLGISYAQKKNEHIKITMLTDRLKGTTRKVVLVLADILAIAILATFMVEGVVVVQKVMAIGSHTPALSIPQWAIYLSVPISCGLMAVRIIADAVRDLRGEEAEGGEAA